MKTNCKAVALEVINQVIAIVQFYLVIYILNYNKRNPKFWELRVLIQQIDKSINYLYFQVKM